MFLPGGGSVGGLINFKKPYVSLPHFFIPVPCTSGSGHWRSKWVNLTRKKLVCPIISAFFYWLLQATSRVTFSSRKWARRGNSRSGTPLFLWLVCKDKRWKNTLLLWFQKYVDYQIFHSPSAWMNYHMIYFQDWSWRTWICLYYAFGWEWFWIHDHHWLWRCWEIKSPSTGVGQVQYSQCMEQKWPPLFFNVITLQCAPSSLRKLPSFPKFHRLSTTLTQLGCRRQGRQHQQPLYSVHWSRYETYCLFNHYGWTKMPNIPTLSNNMYLYISVSTPFVRAVYFSFWDFQVDAVEDPFTPENSSELVSKWVNVDLIPFSFFVLSFIFSDIRWS